MKSFRYYVESKEVRRIAPDPMLAKSLRKDAAKREKAVLALPRSATNATLILENLYEAVRALIEACLAERGYKSYSHVANIAFAKERSIITDEETAYLNSLRELRNSSRYYGEEISMEDARKALAHVPPIMKKILQAK